MKAEIKMHLGTLRIFVDGEVLPPDAYITYFTEKNRYSDFASVGYKLYSLPLFFSSKTLNENSQAPCFGHPIFDNSDDPDWDSLDEDFHKILKACPDALIFPRVNVSLNETWERENPDELCDEGMVDLHRPCFSSDKWAEETMRLYSLAIEHMEASEYADRIIGYQFAAGNTEEWFPHDMKGSIGKRSREKFAEYCAENAIEPTGPNMYAFLSDIVAKRICDLAALTKKKAGNKLVGTFYGYTFECPSRTTCHHSLDKVLACPDIDFICSPVSYAKNRELGRDHGCMLPSDSLREHGKLYFAENDTRTHLTIVPYTDIPYFQNPVFNPKRFDDTVEMLKIHYARALIHGYAHWWFDMWGGWYADETYMAEMKEFLEISKESVKKAMGSVSELAVFIDEKSYKYGSPSSFVYSFREALGKIGTPYDCFLASDYDRVKDRYSAVILLEPCETELSKYIKDDAYDRKVGCLVIDSKNASTDPETLRDFCRANGVHLYTDTDAVVYANESYLFVHSCGESLPEIKLKDGKKLRSLFTSEATKPMHQSFVSALYEIE